MTVILEVEPGFDFSLFFIILSIFLIICGIGVLIYKKVRKNKQTEDRKEIDKLIEIIKYNKSVKLKEAAAEELVERFFLTLPEGDERKKIINVLRANMQNPDYWSNRAFDKMIAASAVKSR